MSRVFVTDQGQPVTIIETFDRIRWTRKYREPGTLELVVNINVDGARQLVEGINQEISVVDDPDSTEPDITFLVDSVTFDLESLEDNQVSITAAEYGLFRHRIALPEPFLPPFDDSHHVINGPAETAMIALVANNCAQDAPEERRVPNLITATDQERGPDREWRSRFEVVSDQLRKWCESSGLGYQVFLDDGEFVFTVLDGGDKSDQVIFGPELDNVQSLSWARQADDLLTVAYVGGQGEGDQREVIEVPQDDPDAGLNRRELFIDARDVESEPGLVGRGEDELADRRVTETITVEVLPGTQFNYRVDWDLGDFVTVRNPEWSLDRVARIVEVQSEIGDDGIIRRTPVVGKPRKAIPDRVRDDIGNRGTERQ